MCLVEHDGVPLPATEALLLVDEQAVGGDDHIEGGGLLDYAATAVAGLVEDFHIESRRKATELVAPVEDERGGHHYEGGTLLGTAEQHGDGLERLAQSHIIGEQRTRAPIGQS